MGGGGDVGVGVGGGGGGAALRCGASLQRKGVKQSWSHREVKKALHFVPVVCLYRRKQRAAILRLAAVCTCGFRAVVLGHPHPCMQSLNSPYSSYSAVVQGKNPGGDSEGTAAV